MKIIKFIVETSISTHQTDEDTDELYDISVSHGIEAAKQSVEDGDTSRHNDGHLVGQTDDNPQGTTYNQIRLSYIKSPQEICQGTCFSSDSRIFTHRGASPLPVKAAFYLC